MNDASFINSNSNTNTTTHTPTPQPKKQYEESAFQWYQRNRLYRKRLRANPLSFPSLHHPLSSHTTNTNTNTTTTNNNPPTTEVSMGTSDIGEPEPFEVTPKNIRAMASSMFFGRRDGWDALKGRLDRYRKRRKKYQRRNSTQTNPTSNPNHGEGEGVSSEETTPTNQRDELEDALLDSFPSGTGLTFLDRILSPSKSERIAMEVSGRSGTAKTHVLMALAANYVVATSTSFLRPLVPSSSRDGNGGGGGDGGGGEGTSFLSPPPGPSVVLFDPEHAISIDRLGCFVRAAVLRRWNVVERFRNAALAMARTSSTSSTSSSSSTRSSSSKTSRKRLRDEDEQTNEFTKEENEQEEEEDTTTRLDDEIRDALGRIHILHPRDVAYGYVAALEALRSFLDRLYPLPPSSSSSSSSSFRTNKTGNRSSSSSMRYYEEQTEEKEKTLVLFDSISDAFEPNERMVDSLPNGSGLSGKHEFRRGWYRLLEEKRYPLVVVWTTRRCGSGSGAIGRGGSGGGGGGTRAGGAGGLLWRWNDEENRTVHRIVLDRVGEGTSEEEEGFEFVASAKGFNAFERRMVRSEMGESEMMNGVDGTVGVCDGRWNDFVPFSVTMDGISC